MSPLKLSLKNPWDDRDEVVELDDELAGKVQRAVDDDPDLTLAEVLRQGLQRIVDEKSGRDRGEQSGRGRS